MGRYYHLSKKISNAESQEILKEMKQLEDVEKVEITKDNAYMMVVTRDNDFTEVMGKAVNICSKIKRDLELSFVKFVFES